MFLARLPSTSTSTRVVLAFSTRIVLALTALFLTTPAAAQVVEPFTNAALDRSFSDRSTQEKPNWINRADCLNDDILTFDVKVVSPTSSNFEVWVGSTDCTMVSSRIGNEAQCWLVSRGRREEQSFKVEIPARLVVARQRPRDMGGVQVYEPTVNDCFRAWEGEVAFYFMYVGTSDEVLGTPAVWKLTGVDVQGPSPPSNLNVGVGEQGLVLEWEASHSSEVVGYNFYCAPSGGDATLEGDAGPPLFVPDAGFAPEPVDNATGSCGAEGLASGQIPGAIQICDNVRSSTATRGFVGGLTNGVEYAMGIAAIDDLGNPGELSNVACNTPENIITFLDDYVDAGGEAGGGICSVRFSHSTQPVPFGLGVLFVLTVLRLRRKNRS